MDQFVILSNYTFNETPDVTLILLFLDKDDSQ